VGSGCYGQGDEMSNMYKFTQTWNPLGGDCIHNCSYCYRNTWKKRFEYHRKKYSGKPRLDLKAMKKNLGCGNFWFVCSMTDLFAENVSDEMIEKVLDYCKKYSSNTYFFQSKNPMRFTKFETYFPTGSILCTTIETDKQDLLDQYSGGNSYSQRLQGIENISKKYAVHVTIEPILDFSFPFIYDLSWMMPEQVNIGSDSERNNLPEPSKEKILELISELEKFTKVYQKSNLKRILGNME